MELIGDLIVCLPRSFPNLEKLERKHWEQLSNEGLIEVLRRYRENLKELDLSFSKITGIGISERVNVLAHLDTLKLRGCCELTDEGMVEFLIVQGVPINMEIQ